MAPAPSPGDDEAEPADKPLSLATLQDEWRLLQKGEGEVYEFLAEFVRCSRRPRVSSAAAAPPRSASLQPRHVHVHRIELRACPWQRGAAASVPDRAPGQTFKFLSETYLL